MRGTRVFIGAALAALACGSAQAAVPAAQAGPDDCRSLQEYSDAMQAWGQRQKALTAPGTRGGTDAELAESQAQHAALQDRLRATAGSLEDPGLGEQARALAEGMDELTQALHEYSDFAGLDDVAQDGLPEQRKQEVARRWQSVMGLAKRRVALPIAAIQQRCPGFWPPQHG